MERNW